MTGPGQADTWDGDGNQKKIHLTCFEVVRIQAVSYRDNNREITEAMCVNQC
jgi:hypothetical protein